MHGFPILPWLALVAVYVASGRMRGSSWTALAATAGGVLAAVFLEFTLAFTLGLAGFASTMLVAAGVAASIVVGRRLRRPTTVPEALPHWDLISTCACRSRSTYGSPLTSTATRLIVPPVNVYGASPG